MEKWITLAKEKFQWGLDATQTWLVEPSTYSQALLAAAAFLLARIIARFMKKRLPLFSANLPNDAPYWRKVIRRSRLLLFPLTLLIFLGISTGIASALFDASLVVAAFKRAATVYLFWIIVKTIFTTYAIRKIAKAGFIIIGVIHFFNGYTPTIEYLDGIVLALGDIKLSVYGVIKMLVAASILFWLGRISNETGQNYIRSREKIEIGTRELLAKVFEIILFVVIFLALLRIVGLDLSALAVFGGALGVGLGFGLQKIASNFISGIILLLEKSVRIGDVIEIDDGTFGKLRKLGARASIIRTYDGKEVMIPNEDFIISRITNYTHEDNLIRYEIPFGVSYDTDIHKVPPLIESAVAKHPQVRQDPEEPDCELQGFGDSSVDFTIEFWVEGINDGKNRFKSEVLFLIWDALKEANIEIPFPQRDLHIRTDVKKG